MLTNKDSAGEKNKSDDKNDNTEGSSKWDIKWLHFFVNPSKKHALGYLLAITAASVAGFFFQEGLQKIKEMLYPDPKIEKLEKIQASSDAIQNTVNDLKAKLDSKEPFNPAILIEKLDFIAQQNSSLLPTAQGLANANSGYVRGAKVLNGPFDGVGSFYMDLNHGKSAGMAQICGNATITYSPVQKLFRLSRQDRSDTRYITNPGSLNIGKISVVIHSAFDSNGSLQLTYDCGN